MATEMTPLFSVCSVFSDVTISHSTKLPKNPSRIAGYVAWIFDIHVHARSAKRSPNNPDGRNTSTAISTKKANTSW